MKIVNSLKLFILFFFNNLFCSEKNFAIEIKNAYEKIQPGGEIYDLFDEIKIFFSNKDFRNQDLIKKIKILKSKILDTISKIKFEKKNKLDIFNILENSYFLIETIEGYLLTIDNSNETSLSSNEKNIVENLYSESSNLKKNFAEIIKNMYQKTVKIVSSIFEKKTNLSEIKNEKIKKDFSNIENEYEKIKNEYTIMNEKLKNI